ncbi:protein-arginine deiminase domain-containing protein [bacterium]|nr:protein-arginine deiminase domain-containing protein [bacterium]
MPNLDADGITLPASVSCGSPPTLDITVNTKSANDNDLIPISVIANPGTNTAQHRVMLKLSDLDAQRVKIYNSSKHLLTGTASRSFVNFPITFAANRVDMFLEAVTFNESPKGPSIASMTSAQLLQGQFAFEVHLRLEVFDLTGSLLESDQGLVSISPLILTGDTSVAERLYMCEIPGSPATLSDNTPSISDVQNVMSSVQAVPFIKVPVSVSRGDSWVQDQFQFGYSQGAGTTMKVVFHLPRLRSDTTLVMSGNSLTCVATDHLPSSNFGLFNDFWTRTIPVRDVSRGTQNVSFLNTVELMILFNKVYELHYYLMRIVMELEPARLSTLTTASDIVSIINDLNNLKNQAVAILDRAIGQSSDAIKINRFRNTKTDIQARVPALLREIHFRNDGALVVQTQNLNLALEPDDAENIYKRLAQLHSSHNYGGNIEVSPPISTAPLGKIVIGNTVDESGRSEMDPDLVRFLSMQQVQPVVEVDTSWLQVGHVDEIVSFGTYPNAQNYFPLILASPQIAMKILEEIFVLNTNDLSIENPDRELYGRPLTLGDSNMARGPHPVTALLRGKQWLQVFRPNGFPIVWPPKIYRDMNLFYGDIGLSTRRFYPIAWADDHFYNARISVREMIYFGYDTQTTAQEKIDTVKTVLSDEFEDMPVLELPVLFDAYNPAFEKTIAFIPDLVNFQIVNNHLIIPRPYGPRMSIVDTIEVLKKVLDRDYHSYLTRRYFERKGLNRTWHWAVNTINELSHVSTGPYNRPVTVDLDWLAEQFKDGFFPETDLNVIKRRIRSAPGNSNKFLSNGNLKTGWFKIEIPENKVDLFEAHTQIMLEGTGLIIDWVDSWYYHVRSGGIHCGTNVVRTPVTAPGKAWWNVRLGRGPGDYVVPRSRTRVV